ncbi:DinB family protein [Virgibacillus sp. DJP39]|uniref:DinB family protein n=1 Tax=Virgibacillus sp. DJP39 TaxID=3409790 RepID=UPI003BB62D18
MEFNEEARVDLYNEVNGLSDEQLNKRPADDQWSIKQIMEHLFLMEGAITKTIIEKLEDGEEVNAELKPIEASLNRTIKVQAPEFAIPNDDFATLEELKLKLTATHQGLIKVSETADEKQLESKGFPHPVFGQMSLKQWIPFIAYHEKRHTLQIVEVKEKLGISN